MAHHYLFLTELQSLYSGQKLLDQAFLKRQGNMVTKKKHDYRRMFAGAFVFLFGIITDRFLFKNLGAYDDNTFPEWIENSLSFSAPKWCSVLKDNPRPRVRWTGRMNDCGRGKYEEICSDGMPRFFSQFNQDIVLWEEHFRFLNRPGVFFDVAAHEPMFISNTYFFEKCLGWEGVCVEANPEYHDALRKYRTCSLVKTCLSNKEEIVEFILGGGHGGINSTNKNSGYPVSPTQVSMRCQPTSLVLKITGIYKIDYLSLDVEGHELHILESIDWKKTQVNVITIEPSVVEAIEFLLNKGFKIEKNKSQFKDVLLVHESVKWGHPQ